ncbi:MAG: hypothetical protein DRH12_10270 [Deltaproteobacteria bacterium]|nr:MAG: hypothetical protein DRH12_10270 [Deltaproteobacteria bacterium]
MVTENPFESDTIAVSKKKWTQTLIQEAIKMAKRIGASAVLFYMDSTKDIEPFLDLKTDVKLILLTKRQECIDKAARLPVNPVRIPDVRLSRLGYLKMGFLSAISKGLLNEKDVIICVGGVPEQGYMDTLIIVIPELEAELFIGGNTLSFPENFRPDVFDTLMRLAMELANEGREGKPVGTTFVLGDHENVLRLSHQLVFNPFEGRPERDLHINDPRVQESIKEFAAIDGAFIIRDDGVVLAAGRYLNVAFPDLSLPQGLGARHAAAAAITNATASVAVVISESTGRVTVFKEGKILTEIERPVPPQRKKGPREP